MSHLSDALANVLTIAFEKEGELPTLETIVERMREYELPDGSKLDSPKLKLLVSARLHSWVTCGILQENNGHFIPSSRYSMDNKPTLKGIPLVFEPNLGERADEVYIGSQAQAARIVEAMNE